MHVANMTFEIVLELKESEKLEIIRGELLKENRSESFFLNSFPNYSKTLQDVLQCLNQMKDKEEISNDGGWWKLVRHYRRDGDCPSL